MCRHKWHVQTGSEIISCRLQCRKISRGRFAKDSRKYAKIWRRRRSHVVLCATVDGWLKLYHDVRACCAQNDCVRVLPHIANSCYQLVFVWTNDRHYPPVSDRSMQMVRRGTSPVSIETWHLRQFTIATTTGLRAYWQQCTIYDSADLSDVFLRR